MKTRFMQNVENRLREKFCCVKCRGKSARIHTVVLPMARILAIFSGQVSPKFYVISCALCGYSEFYDAHVYALQDEAVPAEDALVRETP